MPVHELSRPIKKPGIWRVDGLSEVRQTTHGLDVEVYMSETHSPDTRYQRSSRTGETYKHTANIREAFKLVVGSFWEGRNRLSDPPELKGNFYRVNTTGIQPSRSPSFNGEEILPTLYEQFYHVGENLKYIKKNEFYVLPVIEHERTDFLIIPAHEITRFYIGVSDRLLRHALLNGAKDLVDWEKCTFKQDGDPILVIKRNLAYWERYVCSRALCSDEAYKSLMQPKNHLAKARIYNTTNPRKPLPETISGKIPFQDLTKLEVAGKRFKIQSTKKTEWGVFVNEILHCPYGEDLSDIGIIKDFEGSNHASGNDIAQQHVIPFNRYIDPDINDLPPNIELIPADKKRRRLSSTSHQNRFNSTTFKPTITSTDTPSAPYRGHTNISDALTRTGEDGDYSQHGRGNIGVNEFIEPTAVSLEDLTTFIKATNLLQNYGCINTSLFINGRKHRIGRFDITSFPSPTHTSTSWHRVYNKERRLALVRIQIPNDFDNQYIYIAEMETKPTDNAQCTTILHRKDFKEISEVSLSNYLQLTIDKKVWAHERHTFNNDKLKDLAYDFFKDVKNIRVKHLRKAVIDDINSENGNIAHHWGRKILMALKDNIIEFRDTMKCND